LSRLIQCVTDPSDGISDPRRKVSGGRDREADRTDGDDNRKKVCRVPRSVAE
jgi:hypothetical protein